jgi:hypothetical protein
MFDFEAKADSPNRHRLTRYRYPRNFQKPSVIQYISSLPASGAMRAALLAMNKPKFNAREYRLNDHSA